MSRDLLSADTYLQTQPIQTGLPETRSEENFENPARTSDPTFFSSRPILDSN